MTSIAGMLATEHTLAVPLDHARPDGERIEVFAREVVAEERAGDDLPWLLFLQGGPGGESPRPGGPQAWIKEAVKTHRVLLLDQRGCGRSTPVTPRSVAGVPVGSLTDAEIAGRLTHFRGDSIVADAELLRRGLIGDRPWEVLAQSYGGWVTMSYLTEAPKGLAACYIAGGTPGLDASAEDVYRRTYARVAAKNAAFADHYPDDIELLGRIADLLRAGDVRLPDGDPFTVRRLQRLGAPFGMSDGFERVHWLLEHAFDGDDLSDRFRYDVMAATATPGGPIYALQEWICYAQPGLPTGWAADRVLTGRPEFAADAEPLLLAGEMMHRWMYDEIAGLRPYAGAADLLAARTDWPPLWDLDRLAGNRVPVAAAIYPEDMYVDADLSRQTIGRLGNARAEEFAHLDHDGIRVDGDLLPRLIRLAAGTA